MRRIKKLSCILLVILMVVTFMLAGCQQKPAQGNETEQPKTEAVQPSAKAAEESGPDISEKVNLKLYFLGTKADDTDLVLGKINEKLAEKLNATMSTEYLGWGDWKTQYPLKFASGDDFDGIFAADWAFYGAQAQKNGFMEITEELLTKYAPTILKNTPKADWDQVRVNGKVYMIPQSNTEFNQRHYIIRGDLRKKYNVPEIKTIDDLGPYFDAILKNEKDIMPYTNIPTDHAGVLNVTQIQNEWYQLGNYQSFVYAMYNYADPNDTKVFSFIDTPQYIDHIKRMRDWNQKGYISKSLLSNKTGTADLFKNGKLAMIFHNYGTANSLYNDAKKNHPDWEVEIFDGTAGKKVLPYPSSGGGLGIHATSKHADRLLMVCDYLRYDKEINHLAQRGIQGKHWDIAPGQSNENITVPGPENAKYNGDSFAWGPWRNAMYQSQPSPENSVKGYYNIMESLASRKVNHPLQAFNFNDEKVKNEVAACKSVTEQYGIPLEYGFVDPEAGLATYKEKMKAAGIDKIMTEMQVQVDAYVNSLK